MNFIIRRAVHQDAEAIINSHVRSIREICSKDYAPEQIQAWSGRKFQVQHWRNTMDRDFVWVVEVDKVVRGFGHLAIMSKDTAEIMGLYFAPEAKGLGAGKKLFEEMKKVAEKEGVKEIQLYATKTAKTFYETLGFLQSAGDTSIEMQGVDIPCYPMSLSLKNTHGKF